MFKMMKEYIKFWWDYNKKLCSTDYKYPSFLWICIAMAYMYIVAFKLWLVTESDFSKAWKKHKQEMKE